MRELVLVDGGAERVGQLVVAVACETPVDEAVQLIEQPRIQEVAPALFDPVLDDVAHALGHGLLHLALVLLA